MDKYDYATLEKVETIVLGKDLEGIKYFDEYTFSLDDETKVIIGLNLEQIYRRSKVGQYYVYDLTNKTLEPISELNIQEPTFSPDGNKIAFVYENNIYIKDLISRETIQITTDGEKNKIINGITGLGV